MTKNERQDMIKSYMSYHRRSSIGELSRKLGVSKNTIRHDLLDMSYELPIYDARPGRNGGISVEPKWFAHDIYVSEEEEALLMQILQNLTDETDKTTMEFVPVHSLFPPKRQFHFSPTQKNRPENHSGKEI